MPKVRQANQGEGFWKTMKRVWRTKIYSPKSKKVVRENLGQTLNAIVHIVTASALINELPEKNSTQADTLPKINEYQYTKTVFSFFSATLLVALLLSLITYLPLSLSKHAVIYLSKRKVESYFFALIGVKFLTEVTSALTSFLMGIYQKYVKESMVKSIRSVLIRNIERYDLNDDTVRAYFDDIPAIVSHLSVMIQYVTFVFFYAIYALSHMDLRLVMVAALVGGGAKTLNKGISCIYKLASEFAMQIKSQVRNTMVTLLAPRMLDKIKGVNAYPSLKQTLASENEQLFDAQLKVGSYEELANLIAQIVKSISHNSYLLYFGFALSAGYITVVEMMLLLPFVEQVSECSAKVINLPILSAYTQTSIQNLRQAWNSVVTPHYQVPLNFTPVKFSSRHYVAYAVLSLVCFPLMLALVPSMSPQAALLLWLMITTFSIMLPKSTTSQLFCYLLLVVDYPISWVTNRLFARHQQEGVAHVKSQKAKLTPESQMVEWQDGENHYQLSSEVVGLTMNRGIPLQVSGPNGIGKTRTFGSLVTGKLGQPGLYHSDQCIHITDNSQLIGWENRGAIYGECLALTYGFDATSLDSNLEAFFTETNTKDSELYLGLTSAVKCISGDSAPSNGQQQILNALSGIWKAINTNCSYLCCDEAVSGLTPDNKSLFYTYLNTQCERNNIKQVVIDPHTTLDGYQQVSASRQESNSHRAQFQVVPTRGF
ncbi:MAG: hypothetical protein VXW87_03975 [Pseudomonadota bacterium]|nr:hypothetical protein [Pseudomonadota bacterium]